MATRVMCLGKYKESAAANANVSRNLGRNVGGRGLSDLVQNGSYFEPDETRFTGFIRPRMSCELTPTTSVI